MAQEFKAEVKNGKLIVKAIAEKKGKDIIIHVPSLKLIKKLEDDFNKKNKTNYPTTFDD